MLLLLWGVVEFLLGVLALCILTDFFPGVLFGVLEFRTFPRPGVLLLRGLLGIIPGVLEVRDSDDRGPDILDSGPDNPDTFRPPIKVK